MADNRHVHLVDDDAGLRRSLSLLLRLSGFSIESWASGREFVDALALARPGCVLLDLWMPEIDGMAVLEAMGQRTALLPVIVLTAHGDVNAAIGAMKAGAVDFLEKPVEKAKLVAAVTEATDALRGRRRRSASIARARSVVAALTPREQDVLRGLVNGLSNKAIAQELRISARTVEIHRANAMQRIGARSLSDALRIAYAAGIGDIGEWPAGMSARRPG